ncbi:autotransporter outer membrane beta-barrel domain-containing protein [Sutterella faecalis]|uniref:Autotransporter outer membrane beta-barrel domain-containing protein n=2 Tax=Sutterella faecalis TaxID=2584944 RepID=A0ABX5VEJ3_9BURK|nr:autotransporter outer membrane beta-barrel domain-containing protein [Sutterella faecalis]
MNKTYKVARSLSRGVVVTSEKASARQGKVFKTVFVAVLSALAAAGTEAATHEHTGPLYISNTTFTVSGTNSNLTFKADDQSKVTYEAGSALAAWVNGETSLAQGSNFNLDKGTVVIDSVSANYGVDGTGTIQLISRNGVISQFNTNQTSLGTSGDIVVSFSSVVSSAVTAMSGGIESTKEAFTLGSKGSVGAEAHTVTLDVAENGNAHIDSHGDLILANVVVQNKGGRLELNAKTDAGKEIKVQSDLGPEASGAQTVFGSKTTIDSANVVADAILLAKDKATAEEMNGYSKVFSFTENKNISADINAANAIVTVANGGLLEATTKLDVNTGRTLDINAAVGSSPAGQLKAQELNANGTVNMNGSAEINTVNALSGSQVRFGGQSKIKNAVVGKSGTLTLGDNASSSAYVELGSISYIARETSSGAGDGGQVHLAKGTVRTTSDQLFVKDPSKSGIESIGNFKEGISNTTGRVGDLFLRLTDAAFDYTLDQWRALQSKTKSPTADNSAFIELENALLVNATTSNGKATIGDAVAIGYAGKSAIVSESKSADHVFTLSKGYGITFGSLEINDKETQFNGLTFTGSSPLTLRGDMDGKVFYLPKVTGSDGTQQVMPVTLDVDTTFGDELAATTDKAVVDGKITAKKSVKISKNGDFAFAEDLTLAGTADSADLTIEGRFAGKNIVRTSANANVNTVIAGGIAVLDGTTPDPKDPAAGQGTQVSTGYAVINSRKLESGEVLGGLLVLGQAYEANALQYQQSHRLDNTLWIGQAVTLKDNISFGAALTDKQNATGVNTAVIDLQTLAQSAYKGAADKAVVNRADNLTLIRPTVERVVLANLKNISADSRVYDEAKGLYYLNAGVDLSASAAAAGSSSGVVLLGTRLYQDGSQKASGSTSVSNTVASDGKIYFVKDQKADAELKALNIHSQGVIDRELDQVQFGNALADFFIFDVFGDEAQNAELKAAKEAWTKYQAENGAGWTAEQLENERKAFFAPLFEKIVDAEHAATNMAVEGGAFSSALDYQNEVVGALDRRASLANLNASRTQGFTPWVDVFGSRNKAKTLFGDGEGYEADLYGAVLGFDYTSLAGGVVGVAFNAGKADGNSVGSGARVDNDADYYGFSVYAAQQFGAFNIKGDLGYSRASNDLSTTGVLGSFKESLDADLWTVGAGAEFLLEAGPVNVVPHAGIRMTRLSMDDSKYGADYDDMTVYQLPLGVSVSSAFEMNGWKLAPVFDLSLVPTFGDKDASAEYLGGITATTRVVDSNPVQGTIGLEAQTGAFTFGLNYRLTRGGDDRTNNAFNANVRYAF